MAGFFNRFFEASNIERILSSDDCSLEKLLSCPDFFQECHGHTKLLDYLSEPEQMTAMLDLMLAPDDAELDCLAQPSPTDADAPEETYTARRARLAYIASELLANDIMILVSFASRKAQGMAYFHDYLFRYLSQRAPLSESRVYFSKVFTSYLRNATANCEVGTGLRAAILEHVYAAHAEGSFDIIESMLHHIGVIGIQQAFLTLLTFKGDSADGTSGTLFARWAMEHGLPEGMVRVLSETRDDPDEDEAAKVGVLWVALGILTLDGHGQNAEIVQSLLFLTQWLASYHDPSALAACKAGSGGAPPDDTTLLLASLPPAVHEGFVPSVINVLTNKCLSDPTSPIIPIASDILQRIARAFTYADPNAFGTETAHSMTFGLQCLLKEAELFKDILSATPPDSRPLELQTWVVEVPFGLMRLKILELVRAIGLVDLPVVYSWFFDEGVLELLMRLFEQYQNNNLLHSLVIGVLRSLINAEDDTVDKRLAEEVHLHEWVVTLYRKGQSASETTSYAGYLFELMRVLAVLGSLTLFSNFAKIEGWEELKAELAEENDRRKVGEGPWSQMERGTADGALGDDGDMVTTMSLTGLFPAATAASQGAQSANGSQWEANPICEPEDRDAADDGWVSFESPTNVPGMTGGATANTIGTASPTGDDPFGIADIGPSSVGGNSSFGEEANLNANPARHDLFGDASLDSPRRVSVGDESQDFTADSRFGDINFGGSKTNDISGVAPMSQLENDFAANLIAPPLSEPPPPTATLSPPSYPRIDGAQPQPAGVLAPPAAHLRPANSDAPSTSPLPVAQAHAMPRPPSGDVDKLIDAHTESLLTQLDAGLGLAGPSKPLQQEGKAETKTLAELKNEHSWAVGSSASSTSSAFPDVAPPVPMTSASPTMPQETAQVGGGGWATFDTPFDAAPVAFPDTAGNAAVPSTTTPFTSGQWESFQ